MNTETLKTEPAVPQALTPAVIPPDQATANPQTESAVMAGTVEAGRDRDQDKDKEQNQDQGKDHDRNGDKAASDATPDNRQPPKLDIGCLGTIEQLSQEEYVALLTNEQILKDAYQGSIDIGLALVEIRDRTLYRMEYLSFPD